MIKLPVFFGVIPFLIFGAICEEQVSLAEVDELIVSPDRRDHLFARKEVGPTVNYSEDPDTYLEGYIQGLVDVHYYEFNVIVVVKQGVVTLYNLPQNKLTSNSIISFVSHLPEVKEEHRGEGKPVSDVTQMEEYEVRQQLNGIWFPQSTVLFQPLIADLLEPVYSAGYRWSDNPIGNHVVAVSFGDTFPVFRWTNVGPLNADMQIDIQGGMWAIFNMWSGNEPDGEVAELVTTDYLVGFPLTFAFDEWSFRLRVYHVSSHLGDEFLVDNPGYARVNPSMEVLDFFTSYQATQGIRLYFGPGWIFHSDKTFPMKNFYVEYGTEMRALGMKSFYHKIYGTPFLALNWRNWEVNDWKFDGTYQLGYEWSKLQGVGRKVRLFFQYHHGYSEGQFFTDSTQYWSFRFSYGF
ncbi:MAG: DUF1207 domain-containing protein [Simkaniaceae bacterium]|nr:DUF1207 domain-containing protein [Simkaniaceae bacterium]